VSRSECLRLALVAGAEDDAARGSGGQLDHD
jgi:hypothetical protein